MESPNINQKIQLRDTERRDGLQTTGNHIL